MLTQLLTNPSLFTSPAFLILLGLYLAGLVIAITIHEFAHAWAADKLGDPTPRLQDRLTLNPLAHLDPMGTLLILFVGFGWGKPVIFDPYNLDNPKRDAALIALAGPASNLILATVLSLIIRLSSGINLDLLSLSQLLIPIISLNIMLAVFNLIPIHPLDGGKILIGILPDDLANEAEEILHRYGMIILFLLIIPFSGTSAIGALISPIIATIQSVLLPF